MSTEQKIENEEGLRYLKKIESNSIDLILTDPPYITSQDSGMDRWVKLVEKQNTPGAVPMKTEAQWDSYRDKKDWDKFFSNSEVLDRPRAMSRMRHDYLKYGSIYGTKYAVQTDFGDWDADFTIDMLSQFVHEFYRVLKKGGTAIIFFDLWKTSDLKTIYESAKFKQLRFIEWIKTNPQPRNSNVNYLTNSREIAIAAVKGGKPTFNSKYDNGIYEYPVYSGKDRFHPTQKSLLLFEDLVKKHSNEGEIVLDPFLGSGTTALASRNTGRNFLGCEVDEDFYKKTIDRMKNF
jgi:site-specific DNA-methyltransferase (adenine-specific)